MIYIGWAGEKLAEQNYLKIMSGVITDAIKLLDTLSEPQCISQSDSYGTVVNE